MSPGLFAIRLVIFLPGLAVAGEDRCFSLSQSSHSLKFEYESANQKIGRLHEEISALVESETSDHAALIDHARNVREAKRNVAELFGDAKIARDTLFTNQKLAESLKIDANKTVTQNHALQQTLMKLKEKLQKSLDARDQVDTRIRKEELKIQMLVNDIDASNNTAKDSWHIFADRLGMLEAQMKKSKTILSRAREAFTLSEVARQKYIGASEAEERTKRNIASAQQMLVSASRQKDSLQGRINILQNRVENERAQALAKLHARDKFWNDAVMKAESSIQNLRVELHGVTFDLNKTQSEIAKIEESPIRTSLANPRPQLDVAALRESVKESRRFLSREGYTNRFSLIQANRSSEDFLSGDALQDDITLLGDSSKLLSIEEHLKDLGIQTLHEQQSWAAVVDSLRTSSKEFENLQHSEIIEVDELIAEKKKLDAISGKINSIETSLANLRRRMEAEGRATGSTKHLWKESKRKYDEVFLELKSSNATISETLVASTGALRDYQQRKKELWGLKRSMNRTVEEERRDEILIAELDRNITAGRHESSEIAEMIKSSSESLEENRKHYTETLAVIAQITRRLDEKLTAFDEESRRLDKETSIVEELESNIRNYLSERASLNRKLDEQVRQKVVLGRKLEDLKKELQSINCDV